MEIIMDDSKELPEYKGKCWLSYTSHNEKFTTVLNAFEDSHRNIPILFWLVAPRVKFTELVR